MIFSIDYGSDDGRFPVSATCVTLSNPESLSSSETKVTLENKMNKALIRIFGCQEATGGIYFRKKVKS